MKKKPGISSLPSIQTYHKPTFNPIPNPASFNCPKEPHPQPHKKF
jgi:hypothetical protein